MNPLRPYEIVAPMTVYEVLRTLSRSDRRRTEEFLGKLTRHPSTRGDFECPADDGRIHQAKTVGDLLISQRGNRNRRSPKIVKSVIGHLESVIWKSEMGFSISRYSMPAARFQDFQDCRTNERSESALAYRPDHLAREIRLTGIEQIE